MFFHRGKASLLEGIFNLLKAMNTCAMAFMENSEEKSFDMFQASCNTVLFVAVCL